jgi:tetratricopeptide (TPR) repeat protein
MLLVVGVALVAGIAGALAVVLLGGSGGDQAAATRSRPLAGKPLVVLELPGKPVAGQATAEQTLQAARARLPAGDVRIDVASLVAGYDPGRPDETVRALKALPQDEPVVLLNLGLVERWAGETAAAVEAWRRTRTLDPYGYYGTRADNLLHPDQAQGYPFYFAPRTFATGSLAQLQAGAQRHPGEPERWLALAGSLQLQQRDRAAAIAAARKAAELNPTGLSERVALLVLSYSKDRPAETFGRLGPLLQQTDDPDGEIRFHIALLSLQLGLRDKAAGEFRQVLREHPDGPYATFCREFIQTLGATP